MNHPVPQFLDAPAPPAGPAARGRLEQAIIDDLSDPAGMRIAPKHFYDPLGSALFTSICQLDEYYPTRTEARILDRALETLGARLPPRPVLIDLGAGDCAKGLRLLERIPFAQYVPVDISAGFLRQAIAEVHRKVPQVEILALGADFTDGLALPEGVGRERRVFFYPGSSIGNFTPAQARRLLAQWRELADPQASLLIGVDLVKDRGLLEAAYDDAIGVTAAFNRNVLRHLNRLVDTDFDPRQWDHRAFFDATHSRVEMHLVAREDLVVHWPNGFRAVARGESIHTENSYKYRIDAVDALLADAGWRTAQRWTDENDWFALVLAQPA